MRMLQRGYGYEQTCYHVHVRDEKRATERACALAE